jgi:sulfur relay (sulfurtransferase) complex TusBCD TusD component (DsrE family)
VNIGLCIGTSPGEVKTRFALELAEACQKDGSAVEVFLFDDGIYNALENRSVKCVTAMLADLHENDAAINVCINMAKFRGVNESNSADYVAISSLLAFSELVNKSDIVITTK